MIAFRPALTLLALCAVANPAPAHGLTVATEVIAGRLVVTATYDTGEPVADGSVTLLSTDGTVIEVALTDDAGIGHVALPPPGDYELQVDDGLGHRTTAAITATGTDATQDAGPLPKWLAVAAGLALILMMVLLLKWRARGRENCSGSGAA